MDGHVLSAKYSTLHGCFRHLQQQRGNKVNLLLIHCFLQQQCILNTSICRFAVTKPDFTIIQAEKSHGKNDLLIIMIPGVFIVVC